MKIEEIIQKIQSASAPFDIDLSYEELSIADIKKLAHAIKKTSVPIDLNLGGSDIGDLGIQLLANTIEQVLVPIEIDLSANNIGKQGAKYLSNAIKKASVPINLDVSDNSIDDEGTLYFADAIEKACVPIDLDLSRNIMNEQGMQALAKAISEVTVPMSIHLCKNLIDDKIALYFADAIAKASVYINLDLSYNAVGNEGAQAFAKSLMKTFAPINLNLNNNYIGMEGKKALIDAEEDNFVVEAAKNSRAFMNRLHNDYNFPSPLPIVSLDEIQYLNRDIAYVICEFIGYQELALINIRGINLAKAAVDNKYSTINYKLLGLILRNNNLKNSVAQMEIDRFLNSEDELKRLDKFLNSEDESDSDMKMISGDGNDGLCITDILFNMMAIKGQDKQIFINSKKVFEISQHNQVIIIDPLSRDSSFVGSIEKITKFNNVEVVHAGIQQDDSSCGDHVLWLSNYIKSIDNKVRVSILIISNSAGKKHATLLAYSNAKISLEEIVDQALNQYTMNSAITNTAQNMLVSPLSNTALAMPIALLKNEEVSGKDNNAAMALVESGKIDLVSQISDLFARYISKLNISLFFKKILYHHDLQIFENIVEKYSIEIPNDLTATDILLDSHQFNKIVMCKMHPDKHHNSKQSNQDTIFVRELKSKLDNDIDIKKLLDKKIHQVNSIVHKANMVFKVVDFMVDSARLVYEPTTAHFKKVALDSAYSYSMYTGVNGYSVMVGGGEALYQLCSGEYKQAFNIATDTLSAMSLSYILAYVGIPYLGFIYGIGMLVYTGYYAVDNAYSFISEVTHDDARLKSAIAYKDASKGLSESFLQRLYNFDAIAKGYEIQINNILCEKEKLAIKTRLEAQGQFGQKLFNYVYAPILEEQCNLLNKIVKGMITKEEAELLKAKYITVILQQHDYECVEMNGAKTSNVEYYCFNIEEQILDRVAISGDNNIEIIEHMFS